MSDFDNLAKLSKTELLDAIKEVQWCSPRYRTLLIDLLHANKEAHHKKLFEASQAASQERTKKMNEFFAFKKEMVEKFGDGKRVMLSSLPRKELERGAELERAYFDAVKKDEKAQKALNDYYKENYDEE